MKVILLKDVPQVGQKNDIKDIKDGYAINHLIPQGLVVPATAGNIKRAEQQKAEVEANVAEKEGVFKKLLSDLKGTNIELTAEANEQGHLFKGIGAKDITAAINEKLSVEIEEKQVDLKSPIKTVGEHEVTVVHGDLSGVAKVTVVEEKK